MIRLPVFAYDIFMMNNNRVFQKEELEKWHISPKADVRELGVRICSAFSLRPSAPKDPTVYTETLEGKSQMAS